jgi:putative membrane protein
MLSLLLVGGFFLLRPYVPFGWGGYHMGRSMSMHGGMGFLMPLFWILLIAWIVSLFGRKQSGALSREPDATEILKQRYARGEIDKREFKAKLADLESV